MTLADLAINSFGYQALLFLHILAMIVGFGSTFVYPFLGAEAKQRRGIEAKALSEAGLGTAKIITTPVIYAGGALGLLLGIVGPWDFGDVWLSGAIVVFLASVIFAAFVHVPNLARMNAIIAELATTGPPPAGAGGPPPGAAELEKRGKDAARNGGILHLSLVVLLYLMIWKPGL
jgi:hypothetical protein